MATDAAQRSEQLVAIEKFDAAVAFFHLEARRAEFFVGGEAALALRAHAPATHAVRTHASLGDARIA